jgi:hypothetical protein
VPFCYATRCETDTLKGDRVWSLRHGYRATQIFTITELHARGSARLSQFSFDMQQKEFSMSIQNTSSIRRNYAVAYALVFCSTGDVTLTRYAHGLWPQGFPGQVVGLVVDTGAGCTEADIRAALTVTLLDDVEEAQVNAAVTDHVWCEMHP